MSRYSGSVATVLAGGVAGYTVVTIWSVVHSLFSPGVMVTNGVISVAGGMLVGVGLSLLPAILPMLLLPRIRRWWAILLGFMVTGLWVLAGGFAESTVTIPRLIGALLAWQVSVAVTRWAVRGVPRGALRRDHGEVMIVRGIRAFGMVFFVTIVLFPFLFMISTSFKSRADYLRDPINLAFNVLQSPDALFHGYIQVIQRFSFGVYIVNSTLIALATVVLTLIPAILGAYAVTRLRFPGQRILSRLILLIYMFPAIVLVIPLYSVFTQLGLRDTRPGLLIVYAAMTIPVALYMLRSYFQTLPRDLEEAGLIDGLSRLGVILRITIPLSLPAIASVGLYVFMIAWNEFLFAFMFLDTPAIFTLSRGMIMLDDQEVPRQFLMAGATVITVPIMVLFFRFQRLLVGGLTAGGVKG